MIRSYNLLLISIIALGFLFTGCASTKNTTYFQNISDSVYTSSESIVLSAYSDPIIRPNDILQISVQTIDPKSTISMGTQNTSTFDVQGSAKEVQGYLVDKNGNVELPLVGKIKVGGLSTEHARESINERAKVYYKDPVVNVRLANFYVSVLGEVTRPAQYIIPNEKATILDAIAMAGDLTIYGKRENVMLIRDEGGLKKAMRVNLFSKEIFNSPYFYLRQGDVVYVEANKAKAAANSANTVRTITLATSILTALVLALWRTGAL